MRKTLFFLALLFAIFSNTYGQEKSDSLLIKANEEITNKSIVSDSLLYIKQLNDLQESLFEEAKYFYLLAYMSENSYVECFKTKELDGYAFNPTIKAIKSALSNLKTDFDIWDIKYSSSSILTETNYSEIKRHFLKSHSLLEKQLESNCNRKGNCNLIKQKVIESNEHFNKSLTELINFLKL